MRLYVFPPFLFPLIDLMGIFTFPVVEAYGTQGIIMVCSQNIISKESLIYLFIFIFSFSLHYHFCGTKCPTLKKFIHALSQSKKKKRKEKQSLMKENTCGFMMMTFS